MFVTNSMILETRESTIVENVNTVFYVAVMSARINLKHTTHCQNIKTTRPLYKENRLK